MVDNTIALQVRPPQPQAGMDLATPLMQAARLRQAETASRLNEMNLSREAMGAEARGLVPYINHPEFGQRWGEAVDRLAQQGYIDPQRAAQIRNTPSPLVLQQILAQTDSPEVGLQRQRLMLQQGAANQHGSLYGLPSTQILGALPAMPGATGQPSPLPAASLGPMPQGGDPTLEVAPSQVARENAAPVAAPAAPAVAPSAPAPTQSGAPAIDTPLYRRHMAAAADPNTPEHMKAISMEYIKSALHNSQLTDDQRQYQWARANGDPAARRPFTEWLRTAKRDSPETDAAARRRAVIAEGGDPNDTQTRAFILSGKFPRDEMSATERRAVQDADDKSLQLRGVIDALREAKRVSPNAYGFPRASTLAAGTALIGSERGVATQNLENVVNTQALSQLKSIFGGNPTEGERRVLLELQGSVDKTDTVRQLIYDRAIGLAETRLRAAEQRAEQIRNGSFYGPRGQRGAAPPASQPQAASPLDEARAAIAAGAPRDAVIQRLRSNNIDPSGL